MADRVDFAKVTVGRLDENAPGMPAFKNQKPNMVDHLQKDALNEQNRKIGAARVRAYDGRVALGYVTPAAYSVNMMRIRSDRSYEGTERFPPNTIPALSIGQLATREEYERRGVGKMAAAWATKMAIELSKVVGCRMVVVHSDGDVAGRCEKQKLKKISENPPVIAFGRQGRMARAGVGSFSTPRRPVRPPGPAAACLSGMRRRRTPGIPTAAGRPSGECRRRAAGAAPPRPPARPTATKSGPKRRDHARMRRERRRAICGHCFFASGLPRTCAKWYGGFGPSPSLLRRDLEDYIGALYAHRSACVRCRDDPRRRYDAGGA